MRHHVEDALLTPGRDPAHVVPDGAERALAQPVLVERDEPLLGRAEQRRVLAAPAVRIRVRQGMLGRQRADLLEVGDDLRIRVPHREAGEVLDLGHEPAVVVDGVVDLQAERAAELVVFLAVPGRDVDEPGPGVHRDERRGGDFSGPAIHAWRYSSPSSRRPGNVATRRAPVSRATSVNASASLAATTRVSPPTSSATYSSSGCTAMARSAGSVHGVVVQITRLGFGADGSPGSGVSSGNFT